MLRYGLAMPGSDVEVVVVGGGAAGIAAARRLCGAGVDCLVVEARPRLGGRAWTITDASGFALDLGCGWLHSADRNPWVAVAKEQGATIDRTAPPWERPSLDGVFPRAEQDEFHEAMGEFFARLEQVAANETDVPSSAALEPGGRWNGLINAVSTYISGAEWDRVSAKDFDRYADSGVNWRVVEGLGSVIAAAGANLPAMLDCPVHAIDHAGKRLRMETVRGAIAADQAIVTVPSTLLANETHQVHAGAAGESPRRAGSATGARRQAFHRSRRRRRIRNRHARVRAHRSCGDPGVPIQAAGASAHRSLFRRHSGGGTRSGRRRRIFRLRGVGTRRRVRQRLSRAASSRSGSIAGGSIRLRSAPTRMRCRVSPTVARCWPRRLTIVCSSPAKPVPPTIFQPRTAVSTPASPPPIR